MSTSRNPLVTRYLEQLSAAFDENPVPESERMEILREIESHLAEALAAGGKVHEELEKLGPAEELARGYGVELLLNPRPRDMPAGLRWIATTVTHAGAAGAVLILAIVMGAIGVSLTLAGLTAVLAGLVGPFIPADLVDPTLRAGLPQLLVIGTGLVLVVVGLLSLRLVHVNLRFLLGALKKSTWRTTS